MGVSCSDEKKSAITAIVIDDDKDTADVLSEFLKIKGIAVLGKEYGGLEAVKMYEDLRPDIVFLDVMMRTHDGFYTLKKIREIQPDAIIILITADSKVSTMIRLLELNASAIIYKPYDINEVMEVANRLVRKLTQELKSDIAARKARLSELNTILRKRLQSCDTETIRRVQYYNGKENMA